jgi:serine/threonine protein kinase
MLTPEGAEVADRLILASGDVFAGYTIQQVLGVGGMGAVYLAAHPRLPRSVALKLLHRDLTGDNYVRTRFELEADHVARLEHPNIVTVHDRGQESDQLWIAMQYVESTDAAAAIEIGPLTPDRAVHVIAETAKALDYAHAQEVLHRDVKPANILLESARPGQAGRVLLTDFGIAKAMAETANLTQTGMLVLSLHYASPEQFDNVSLDARTDVYSLGCTLFHLLTGEVPYPGDTLPQLWSGHVHGPIPCPSDISPGVPSAFDAVIARAIAKNREERYATCGELAADARDALRPTRTRGVSPTGKNSNAKPITDQDRSRPGSTVLNLEDAEQVSDITVSGPTRPHSLNFDPSRNDRTVVAAKRRRARPRMRMRQLALGIALGLIAVVAGLYFALKSHEPSDRSDQSILPFTGLSDPSGIAVSLSGDVYVADGNRGRVVKFAAGSDTPTELPFPVMQAVFGVAVTPSGDVYATDTDRFRVLKLAAESQIPIEVGTFDAYSYLYGLVVTPAADVYVTDGTKALKLAAGATVPIELAFAGVKEIFGIAVSATGDVYVTDLYANRVLKLAAGSSIPTALPFTDLRQPRGIAVTAAGDVYVTDHDRVLKLTAGSNTPTELPFIGIKKPYGIAVTTAGDVYITETDSTRVLRLTAS